MHVQANQMVEKALMDPDAAEGDVSVAPRLLEVIMQRCRGRVDACIPLYLHLALQRCAFALCMRPCARVHVRVCVCMCLCVCLCV